MLARSGAKARHHWPHRAKGDTRLWVATVARIRELLQLLKFVSAQCAPPTPHPPPHSLLSFSTSIPCRKFVSPYQGEARAATRAVLPIPIRPSVCSIILCPHTGTCLSVFGMFNVRTDIVAACDCTRGPHKRHKRVFTESWLCGEKKNLPGNACHVSDCSCGREINNNNKTATRAVFSPPCMHLPMHNCMYTGWPAMCSAGGRRYIINKQLCVLRLSKTRDRFVAGKCWSCRCIKPPPVVCCSNKKQSYNRKLHVYSCESFFVLQLQTYTLPAAGKTAAATLNCGSDRRW